MASEQHLDFGLEELYRRAERSAGDGTLTLRAWVDLAEAWRIALALRECRGNRSAAARALGIGRRTLYSKMNKLGVGPAWGVWPAHGVHDGMPASPVSMSSGDGASRR